MGLIHYKKDNRRLKYLKKEIKHYENLFSIEKVVDIFLEYVDEYRDCIKHKVKMDKFNMLELYHANLMYIYNKI